MSRVVRYQRLRRTSVGLAVFLTTLLASPADAYRMIQNTTVGRVTAGSAVACNHTGGFAHWTNSSIPWRLNTAGQGNGKATAITNALATWTNVTNADHNLTYAGTTTAGWATDGTNTVLWANGNGCTFPCLALTALVLQAGQVIVESDITFNSNVTWTTNGNTYDTQAVATHEFGHALGIHHTELTSTPRPTMYASYFGSDARTLETDDRSALQCAQSRYPFSPPQPPTIPATPAWLDAQSEFCLGYASLSWASSTGATSYQLQRANNFGFTAPHTLYTGGGTFFSGDLVYQTGTTYFRVRACNTAGCSAYQTTIGLSYYPNCTEF